jgi:peptidoglycan/xylan/chitin deacetylase (PgdA/CDA1 family)
LEDSTNEKKVFLTFDDGPTPEITEWVLAQLNKYNAKATFFCIGDNIKKHPEIFQKQSLKIILLATIRIII